MILNVVFADLEALIKAFLVVNFRTIRTDASKAQIFLRNF